jgi:hypothetical protein
MHMQVSRAPSITDETGHHANVSQHPDHAQGQLPSISPSTPHLPKNDGSEDDEPRGMPRGPGRMPVPRKEKTAQAPKTSWEVRSWGL